MRRCISWTSYRERSSSKDRKLKQAIMLMEFGAN
jgi:hypothetical protein